MQTTISTDNARGDTAAGTLKKNAGLILLLVIMDLLLAVAGVLSARPLQEASR